MWLRWEELFGSVTCLSKNSSKQVWWHSSSQICPNIVSITTVTVFTGPNWLKKWLSLMIQVNDMALLCFCFFSADWDWPVCLWKLINASMGPETTGVQRLLSQPLGMGSCSGAKLEAISTIFCVVYCSLSVEAWPEVCPPKFLNLGDFSSLTQRSQPVSWLQRHHS